VLHLVLTRIPCFRCPLSSSNQLALGSPHELRGVTVATCLASVVRQGDLRNPANFSIRELPRSHIHRAALNTYLGNCFEVREKGAGH
jgi:hypothetical protein